MEATNFHDDNCIPLDEYKPESIKALRDVHDALTMKTRRDARVNHEVGTVHRAILMLISSILLECGLENVILFLKAIQRIIYEILCLISGSLKPLTTLKEFKSFFNPENKKFSFTINRTTVTSMIPNANRSQLDELLGKQAIDCKTDLKDSGVDVGAIYHVVDGTHEKTHTKYRNNTQSHVVIGQQSTWENGFTYDANFDSTSHLFVGLHHKDRKMSDKQKKDIRPWLQMVFEKCEQARKAGFSTAVIAGDRYYFTGEFFAAATLGLIDPGATRGQEPRVVVPVKFTREKKDFKWNYLLNENSKQVYTRYIGLNPYTHPALKNFCGGIFEKNDSGRFMVPYACVAMVDEYSKKSNRSVGELQEEAHHVQDKIFESEQELERAIESYLVHYESVHGKEGKKPSFGRGARRKKFKNAEDKALYNDCFAKKEEIKKWKEKKEGLLKSLMFFAISLMPGEDPLEKPSKFIAFARDYHERWGIEIGFKDVKARFLGENRSRRPVRRSFHLVIGMMLYNRWQVNRGKAAMSYLAGSGHPSGPPDASRSWIRRKIEKECDCLPTAVGFLVDCWSDALLSVVKNVIKEKK